MPLKKLSCTKCPLHQGVKSVCIPTDKRGSEILVLGGYPMGEDDRMGGPLNGVAWTDMQGLLGEEGFSSSLVVRCQPPNRRPLPKEAKTCATAHLYPELEKLKPKLIIALGDIPTRALLGFGGVLKRQGQIHQSDHGPVLISPHPSYFDKEPQKKRAWKEDMKRSITQFLTPKEDVVLDYQHPLGEVDVASLLSTLEGPVGFDYETTGLDPFKGSVRSVALSDGEGRAWAFDPAVNVEAWKEWLAGPCLKVAHQASFEGVWSEVHYGVYPQGMVWDTKLAAKLEDENDKQVGLKDLSMRLTTLGDYAYEVKKVIDTPAWATHPIDDVMRYNCFDADATRRIAFLQDVDENLMLKTMGHVEAVTRMRTRGMPIHLPSLRKMKRNAQEGMEMHIEEMRKFERVKMFEEKFGPITPDSHKKIAELVFHHLGLPMKDGKASVSAEYLKWIAGQHPFTDHLLLARQYSTALKNFLKVIEENQTDGVLHPDWKIGGADTWRISCAKPNLQNIPKDSALKIRNLFQAPPGYVFLEMDYSQIELRILAHFSQDPVMLKAFEDGEDIHMATAARAFDTDSPTKEQRSRAKAINFGIIYGMQAGKLSRDTGMSKTEAAAFIAKYFRTFPRIQAWLDKTRQSTREKGYTEGLFGYVRRLPGITSENSTIASEAERKAGNFPIQNASGIITLDAMVLLEKYECAVGQVHDSIFFMMEEKYLDSFVPEARKEMVRAASVLDVPIKVDGKVGTIWGEMNAIEA